jgi:crotonobetainyl-CoA:carnitine CoA-transferase CaiB-like acyl-CoA transferase
MLEGIRIVEVEALGPAPFAGMMLADLGAEVIVVHRRVPAGTPGMGERSLLDRGKRSIALDLKDPQDLAVLEALVARADGLIEGFRPGVMERLGMGPEAAHALNPALVYGRMTGWGQEGPRAAQAGHDLNYIGLSGALWYASPPGTPPLTPPTLVGDIGGGALYLVAGMLAGLLKARATGRGSVVDAAIVDGSAHMMALLMSMAPQGAVSMTRGRSLLDGPHWCRTYVCACGGFVTVQCLERKFYDAFLDRMGLAEDADFADQFDAERWPRLIARLAGLFAQRSRDDWAAHFEGSDACVAPVLDPEEAARDPHMTARGTWVRAESGLQPAPAPRFDGHAAPLRPAPARGEHGAEIRAWLEGRA